MIRLWSKLQCTPILALIDPRLRPITLKIYLKYYALVEAVSDCVKSHKENIPSLAFFSQAGGLDSRSSNQHRTEVS